MDIILERILSLIPRKPDGSYLHGAKKEFCEKVGLASNTVTEWESGRNGSYTRYLHEIAAAYGVSVSWLLGETDEKKPAAPKDDELGELIALLRSRPELRALLSSLKETSREEVEASGVLFALFDLLAPEQKASIIHRLQVLKQAQTDPDGQQ